MKPIDAGEVNRLKICRDGLMLYNPNDKMIGRSLDLYGEWAVDELRFIGALLRPGDTAVDVGANLGTHTVFMAKKVGPQGRVVSFEPQRVICQTLCANVALGSLFNVRVLHAAAGAQPGECRVPDIDYTKPYDGGGVSLRQSAGTEVVPIVSIDSLALPQCRLLKIDVEGMEREVIEGARQTIERHRSILYVENNRSADSRPLIEAIDELGYASFWHFVSLFNPDNFCGNSHNAFGELVDANMICVHRSLAELFSKLTAVEGPSDNAHEALRRVSRK